MTTLTFGNYPADMNQPDWLGYGAFFPGDTNMTVFSVTSTEVILSDPLSGSTVSLFGTFDTSSEDAWTGGPITGALIQTASNELLYDLQMNGLSITFQQISNPPGNDFEARNAQMLSGDDMVIGGSGSDYLRGYDGNDSIIGGAGNDSLLGGEGNDVIDGGSGDDLIGGGTGTLNGGPSGNNTLIGGDGEDTASYYFASVGVTVNLASGTAIHGGGADVLSGIEDVKGGAYGDTLIGDDGANALFGNEGNDTLLGGLGSDYLQGNAGDDSLGGGIGNDSVFGGQGNDALRGGADDDLVRGALGNDEMRGGQGNDTLLAGQGDDTLYGGLGNDRLYGLLGNDVLTGGDGADVFVFNTLLDAATNLDVITDFQPGMDQIHLDPTIFTALAGQAGNYVGLSQYLTYDSATGLVAYDADGSGAGSAVTFANIGSGLSLGTDFFIGV